MIAPMLLIALVGVTFGCARNRSSEAAAARIHDTALSAHDTVNHDDTLPRIRDTAPDSTRH